MMVTVGGDWAKKGLVADGALMIILQYFLLTHFLFDLPNHRLIFYLIIFLLWLHLKLMYFFFLLLTVGDGSLLDFFLVKVNDLDINHLVAIRKPFLFLLFESF
jgi:hypothetical protein